MEKCWLIRTRNKQILGPVTKQKIIEFIDKGSLAPEDEVTSGNGYWISIKENNLIEKYVKGDIPQGFNPISEAPNILTLNQTPSKEGTGSLNPNTMPKSKDEGISSPDINFDKADALPADDDLGYPDMSVSTEDVATPSSDDLEYPDMGIVEDSPVKVSKPTSTSEVKPSPIKMSNHIEAQEACNNEEGKLPDSDDLEYPDMGELSGAPSEEFDPDATDPSFDLSSADITQDEIVFSEPPQVLEEETPDLPDSIKKKASPNIAKRSSSAPPVKKKRKVKKKVSPQRNDRYLFYLLVLLIGLIASGAYYYFTNIINSDVVKFSNPLIPSVHAQTPYSGEVKKKTFLKYLHS